MSDDQAPPQPPADDELPPSPPPPPPSEPPPATTGGGDSTNRVAMLWLAYAWVLALFPFLLEKEDKEVQWHAKHGLVLTGAELIIQVVVGGIGSYLACLGCIASPIILVAAIVFRVMAAMKALEGERLTLPVISELADRF